jgi:hypothetical protein
MLTLKPYEDITKKKNYMAISFTNVYVKVHSKRGMGSWFEASLGK